MSCPICGKDADPKYRPFCSKRCADVDLARWLNGSYVIPGDIAEEEERAPTGPAGDDTPPASRTETFRKFA